MPIKLNGTKSWQRIYYFTDYNKIFNRMRGDIILMGLAGIWEDDPEECPHPNLPGIESIHFFHISPEDLPEYNHVRQLYTDDNLTVKSDLSWDTCLMPPDAIKPRHINRLNLKIDEELVKNTPNPIKALAWQREISLSEKWTDKKWYEQALINLDENVSKGNPDKTQIRSKLIHRTTHRFWK